MSEFDMYYYIEPEVAGGWGAKTVADTSVHPPQVSKLHYEFAGWLGDDLIESFPCFIVTDVLKNALEHSDLSGFFFEDVLVTKADSFDELQPNIDLPKFYWFKVTGVVGVNDFGIASDYRLVVSERALLTIQVCTLKHASIEVYP